MSDGFRWIHIKISSSTLFLCLSLVPLRSTGPCSVQFQPNAALTTILMEFILLCPDISILLNFFLCNKNQQDALFYSQFISIINLYMFWAGLLLIIRRCLSVHTAIGMYHALCWLAASQHNTWHIPIAVYTVEYSAFETWWHMVMHGRGSEGETGEWSG